MKAHSTVPLVYASILAHVLICPWFILLHQVIIHHANSFIIAAWFGSLKGQGHGMKYFLRPLKLNQYFLEMLEQLLIFERCLLKKNINRKFMLAFLKKLIYFKYCSGSRIWISLRLFFSAIDQFSSLALCFWFIFSSSRVRPPAPRCGMA